jgi:hypothetical protein
VAPDRHSEMASKVPGNREISAEPPKRGSDPRPAPDPMGVAGADAVVPDRPDRHRHRGGRPGMCRAQGRSEPRPVLRRLPGRTAGSRPRPRPLGSPAPTTAGRRSGRWRRDGAGGTRAGGSSRGRRATPHARRPDRRGGSGRGSARRRSPGRSVEEPDRASRPGNARTHPCAGRPRHSGRASPSSNSSIPQPDPQRPSSPRTGLPGEPAEWNVVEHTWAGSNRRTQHVIPGPAVTGVSADAGHPAA